MARRLVGFVVVLLTALGGVAAADPARTPALPEARGLQVTLFDDASGSRIGRLEVGRVGLEFRKQGFHRVAWRPGTVWTGVTLDLRDAGDLAARGDQVLRALARLGGVAPAEMREVSVRLPGAAGMVLEAREARLLADGRLQLADPTEPDQVAGMQSGGTLWLAGPRAGRWEPRAPARRRVARADVPYSGPAPPSSP